MIKTPKKEIMLNSAPDIDRLCKPIKKFGIKFFSYVKIFNDGSRINLNTDAVAAEYMHYTTDYYKGYLCESAARKLGDSMYYGPDLKQDKAIQILRDHFDIDNMLIFIRNYPHCTETYNFGTAPSKTEVINFYLNNLEQLKKFQLYFKEQTADLLSLFNNNRLNTPIITDKEIEEFDIRPADLQLPVMKRYFIEDTQEYLTIREVECLYWLAQGKTSEEIALILNIKKRTVESYMNNAKEKLRVTKQTSLVYKAKALGIIS